MIIIISKQCGRCKVDWLPSRLHKTDSMGEKKKQSGKESVQQQEKHDTIGKWDYFSKTILTIIDGNMSFYRLELITAFPLHEKPINEMLESQSIRRVHLDFHTIFFRFFSALKLQRHWLKYAPETIDRCCVSCLAYGIHFKRNDMLKMMTMLTSTNDLTTTIRQL